MLLCKGFLSDNLIFNQHKFSFFKLYYFACSVKIIVTISAKLAYTNFNFFKGETRRYLTQMARNSIRAGEFYYFTHKCIFNILHEIEENKNLIEQ